MLSARVIQKRDKVSLGDGGDPHLLRRIRGHANFAEYVPLILLMIGMLELGGMRAWVLHLLGATLLLARVLHGVALSFTDKWKFGRFYGTLLTFILLLVGALLTIWQGVQGLA